MRTFNLFLDLTGPGDKDGPDHDDYGEESDP
jgi:hypothetical protein